MATNPEVIYPNTPAPGAINYPTTIGGSKREFGNLFIIAPDELSGLNKTSYPDSVHTLDKHFPWGKGEILIKLYVEDTEIPSTPDPIILTDNVIIGVYAHYSSGGVDHDTLLSSNMNVVINNVFYCNATLAKTYGIKFCFTTYYNAVTEGTAANNILFECYSPAIATVWDSLVPYMNVVPGARLYSNPSDGEGGDLYVSDQGIGYGIAKYYRSAADMHIGYYNCGDLVAFTALFNSTVSDITIDIPTPSPNPAGEDDPSGPGGGGGDYDPSSDPIDFPELPTGGAFASGAIKAFSVTSGTIQNIFLKLWDASVFDLDNFQKLLESPIDAIISLQAVPVSPTVANDELIKLGGYNTQEYGKRIPSQYMTIDCGSLAVNEYWGSALDYAPYTNIEIYLPFIGIKSLKIEDCMRKTLHVKYNIDISTGALVANIKCGQSVLYKFNGSFMNQIPVSARVYDAIEQLIKGAAQVGTAAIMGNAPGAVAATISTAVNVALSKAQVTRAGDLSGIPGVLDDFVPYLIIHRPVQSLAQNYKLFKGYTSNVTAVLGSLTGYTEVEYIHLTGIDGATDTELNEIEDLLKNGVII